eukprot:TRINITY_DN5253_c0_g2_i2.p1 TRINITY_DN5253_c0_g2~~TRINITY_DN5253_c0_g2_i2.p1  ORF type:complete len:254 (-),score=62.85 TRINITY_DN5253_c0_g2_i2:404-1165(-)
MEQLPDGLSAEAMAALAAHLAEPAACNNNVEYAVMERAAESEENKQYAKKEYWEQRFGHEEHKEWLCGYDQIASVLNPVLESVGAAPSILLVGCGNSSLGPDLYDAGFHDITNTDYASSVITAMSERFGQSHPELVWMEADMTDMHQFQDATFNVVIDKAGMDAIMADEGSPWSPNHEVVQAADRTCSEIRRLLAPGGVFVQVSFMQPHFRTKYLDRSADPAVSHTLGEPYGWDVEVQRLDAGLGYFMYTMRL